MSGHKTQSAQISQKQNGHNVYVYVIMKTRCLPSYHHNAMWQLPSCGNYCTHLASVRSKYPVRRGSWLILLILRSLLSLLSTLWFIGTSSV